MNEKTAKESERSNEGPKKPARKQAIPGKKRPVKRRAPGKKVKSVYLVFYYIGIIAAVFLLIYFRELFRFLGRLRKSEDGILLGIFNKIAFYFQNADKWNLVFIIFFLSILLILFVINDLIIGAFFKWITSKIKSLKFLNGELYRYTIQKGITALALFLQVVILLNLVIVLYAKRNTLTNPKDVPGKKVVLLLGTSKYLTGTQKENLYYSYRITACMELYNAGVVYYFIISGDKTGENYNEPQDMKNDLVSKGVNAELVKLDTAGFRTLDSILRLRSIFGIKEAIIVSQNFHVQRALFLSWFYRLNAWGYSADGKMTNAMAKREILAKPKVMLDLFFFNMQPRLDNANYRAEFKVSSDLHVLLILLLGILMIMSFTLIVKSFD